MSGRCLLSGSTSYERCHVIPKGPDCKNFIGAYERIYPYSEYVAGIEDSQNIALLRQDYHRGPMDNLSLPLNLRERRIGFDFLNKASYIESFETGEIEKVDWQYTPDVKREYFAWSNNKCTRRLRKYMRKINRSLIDYSQWTQE